jgi:hypothetical protein
MRGPQRLAAAEGRLRVSILTEAREAVDRANDEGWTFGDIEERIIDAAAVADDAKAALWLYAWSFVAKPYQRVEALAHLGVLETGYAFAEA